MIYASLASWANTIAADLRQDLCCLCTGILDTTGMPHPFDTNYYANTGAFGPNGLLYVAQAAGGTDDSFDKLLYRSICCLTYTSNLPSLPNQCGSAHMSAAEQLCPCSAGAIVVFDTTTSSPGKYVKTFTDNTASGCGSLLHRPDYPLWAKDGRLYINGFKAVRNVSLCTPHCAMHLHHLCMVAPSVLIGRYHSAKSYRKQATSSHGRQSSFQKATESILLRCLQSPDTSDVVLAYGADGQCEDTVTSFDTPAQSAQGFRDFGTPTAGPGPDIPLYTAMFDACEPSRSHASQH